MSISIYRALFFLFFVASVNAQHKESSVIAFQEELTAKYKNPEKSPLRDKANDFKGHVFYPIDTTYRVKAVFTRTLGALPFQMKTTSSRSPIYQKYGEATFEIQGQPLKLSLYQSHRLRDTEKYKNYLFLPFTDLTNGNETYAGGRFIDMEIPEGNTVIIDFNKAYNPYCAYAKGYSCPIPPKENSLPVAIKAGIMKPKK